MSPLIRVFTITGDVDTGYTMDESGVLGILEYIREMEVGDEIHINCREMPLAEYEAMPEI